MPQSQRSAAPRQRLSGNLPATRPGAVAPALTRKLTESKIIGRRGASTPIPSTTF